MTANEDEVGSHDLFKMVPQGYYNYFYSYDGEAFLNKNEAIVGIYGHILRQIEVKVRGLNKYNY